MGVSKSGDKFIMRETSHTDEIEGTTLAELAEWVASMIEEHGKEAKFELTSEDDNGNTCSSYYHIEREAVSSEVERFKQQQEVYRLKTEERERADLERLQAKYARRASLPATPTIATSDQHPATALTDPSSE